MTISKTKSTNPSFSTTPAAPVVKAPAPQTKSLTPEKSTFTAGTTTQAATTPKKPSVTRDLTARTAPTQAAQTAAPAQSALPFKPNAQTLANAEKSGLGKLAATEVPKNAQYYNKASELTGVPASMIAGLHGNESQFGTYKSSTNGPESGYGLDPRYVKTDWANQQLAKHGLGTWERGTNSDKSKLQSAVVAAEHFKRNAGYAGIEVGPNMSKGDIAGAATAYIAGPGAGKKAKANEDSWMFRPNDTNPHPRHPGGTSIGAGGKTIRVEPSRKDGLLRWDTLLPITEKHLGGGAAPGAQAPGGAAPGAQAPGGAAPGAQAPGGAAPGAQAPGGAAPGAQAPGGAAPGAQAPGGAAPAPNTGLGQTAAQNGLKTNQDLINHLYKQGGGSWDGAQAAAQQMGVSLNDLIQNRGGAISGAASPAPAGATGQIAAQNGLQTNQDLINHFYKQGGGTWDGAQAVARQNGADLNQLIQNRQGSIGAGAAPGTTAPGTTAPGTTAPGTTAPGTTAPGAQGPGEVAPVAPPAGGNAGGVLDVARNELALGVRENAGNNEDTAGNIRKYRNAVTAPGYRQNRGPEAWCADFVSYAFKQAGKPLGPDGKGFAAVSQMKDWMRQTGRYTTGAPQPGDVAFFKDFSHVAIVESVNRDGTVTTIEGNTSPNGGGQEGLHRKTRRMSGISGYGRM